jgi:hypothetical protein
MSIILTPISSSCRDAAPPVGRVDRPGRSRQRPEIARITAVFQQQTAVNDAQRCRAGVGTTLHPVIPAAIGSHDLDGMVHTRLKQ